MGRGECISESSFISFLYSSLATPYPLFSLFRPAKSSLSRRVPKQDDNQCHQPYQQDCGDSQHQPIPSFCPVVVFRVASTNHQLKSSCLTLDMVWYLDDERCRRGVVIVVLRRRWRWSRRTVVVVWSIVIVTLMDGEHLGRGNDDAGGLAGFSLSKLMDSSWCDQVFAS